MSEHHFQNQIDRLYRRILMTLAPVKITATDDTDAVHRAQVRIQGTPEVLDRVPVLMTYGLASHAPAGADGAALFVTGQRSNAVIVATGHQASRLRGLKPGEVALYSDEGSKVLLARDKTIILGAGEECRLETKRVTIEAFERVRIETPLLEVTGEIVGPAGAAAARADAGRIAEFEDRIASLESRIAALETRGA